MRKTLRRTLALAVVASAAAVTISASALASTGIAGSVKAVGTTKIGAGAPATSADGKISYEFAGAVDADSASHGKPNDRSLSVGSVAGTVTTSDSKVKSNPELGTSFDGINHFQQRFGSAGQLSLEPPDQGLCVGNGYVLESVNDTLRVYDTSGKALTAPTALNAFYNYAPAIDRTTGVRGPFLTDPTCAYDASAQRWFQVVLTLDTTSSGSFVGTNHLDIAVSQSADPRGAWTVYREQVANDCTSQAMYPCLGDYPHIGFDANGFYVTTNSYPFFTDGFDAAWIYAYSKAQLESSAFSVNRVKIDTAGMDGGDPGFTVLPASGSQQVDTSQGGTQYFLSSNAAEEANGSGASSTLLLWALSNTASLDSAVPDVQLTHAALSVGRYALPPAALQKAGDTPLATCVADAQCAKVAGVHPSREVEGPLDASDTRVLAATFAQNKVWGALDTAVNVGGQTRAGIEWFVVNASSSSAGVTGSLASQGYTGLANNDLTYPAIGVTSSGRGVIGFTASGSDYYPSQGYAGFDALAGVGAIHIAAAGVGPQDGFSEYKAFGTPLTPRWGDYGAAAVDGSSVWLANEYIGQTCSYSEFVTTNYRCGDTRTLFANWDTRISKITP